MLKPINLTENSNKSLFYQFKKLKLLEKGLNFNRNIILVLVLNIIHTKRINRIMNFQKALINCICVVYMAIWALCKVQIVNLENLITSSFWLKLAIFKSYIQAYCEEMC